MSEALRCWYDLCALPAKRADPFGMARVFNRNFITRDHPGPHPVGPPMFINLFFGLYLLDELYDLIGNRVLAVDKPILAFTEEGYLLAFREA